MNKEQLHNLLNDFKNQILTSIQDDKNKKDKDDSVSQASTSRFLPQIGKGNPYGYPNPYHPNPYAFMPRNSKKIEDSSESSVSSDSDISSDSSEETETTVNNTYSYMVGKKPNKVKHTDESVFDFAGKKSKK